MVRAAFWVWVALLAGGCAAGDPVDAGRADAGPMERMDAGEIPGFDAGPEVDAGPAADGGPGMDAGDTDAGSTSDAGPGVDAGAGDAGSGSCPSISAGHTLALDGSNDIGKYMASQQLTPGGMLGSSDVLGISWDRDYLYVTLSSPAFSDGFRPLHVYIEASSGPLGAAAPGQGKEYDSLIAEIGFTPTHLIGVRPTNAAPMGMPYNALWTPAASWTTQAALLADGAGYWASSSEVSARVAWSDLGCPTNIRLTAHLVYAQPANEWKDFVPLTATPWMARSPTATGGYYEIDLTGPPDATGWTDVP